MRIGTSRTSPIVPNVLQSAEIKVIDLNSIASLRAGVRGVTAIIHLAALNAGECAVDPERALFVNTLGTLKLIQTALDEGVDRVIYFSTAHVYGAPLRGKLDELSVTRPEHPYSITHRSAEDYILQASDAGRLQGTVLRLSNAVGPPVSADSNCWMLLTNDLSRQAVESNKLVLHSSRHQQRNFIAIGDVVGFVEQILESKNDQFTSQIVNLGGLKSFTTLEMAELIRDRCWAILRQRPTLVISDVVTDCNNERLDFRIDKARQLGFSPNINIESELDATLLMSRDHFSQC